MNPRRHQPLTNDLDRELAAQPEAFTRRLRRWLSVVFLPLEPPPHGRALVDRELAGRASFPANLWSRAVVNAEITRQVLQTIATIGGYPNAHFAPDDLLLFIVRSSGVDWLPEQLLDALEDEGYPPSESILERALADDWTLERFVEALSAGLAQHPAPSG